MSRMLNEGFSKMFKSLNESYFYEVYRAEDEEVLESKGGFTTEEAASREGQRVAKDYEDMGYGDCLYHVEVEDEEELTESSKRDDIDADADDKKEKAKAVFMKKKDDADSDKDYKLKKDGMKEPRQLKEESNIEKLKKAYPKEFADLEEGYEETDQTYVPDGTPTVDPKEYQKFTVFMRALSAIKSAQKYDEDGDFDYSEVIEVLKAKREKARRLADERSPLRMYGAMEEKEEESAQ